MTERLTPAQRHLQRMRERFAAGASAIIADASPASSVAARASLPASPARQQLERKLARIAAGVLVPANDNMPEVEDAGEAAARAAMSAHHLLLLQLDEHRRTLSDTQSVERKVALKREFLPTYSAWILGVLEADQAGPDEIATYAMIWSLDVGDYAVGLELAEHHLKHGIPLPERFKRDLATYVTEIIAEAAIKALTPPEGLFPQDILCRVELLAEGRDMPDQARAKLHKAIGLECAHLADNPPENHAVAGWRKSQLQAAIDAYRRALELDSSVGVKKAIEILEREIRKEATE